LTRKLSNKVVGAKLIANLLLKNLQEWLAKTSNLKPKYAHLVALENSHYLMDTLVRASKAYPGHAGYLEGSMVTLRQSFE